MLNDNILNDIILNDNVYILKCLKMHDVATLEFYNIYWMDCSMPKKRNQCQIPRANFFGFFSTLALFLPPYGDSSTITIIILEIHPSPIVFFSATAHALLKQNGGNRPYKLRFVATEAVFPVIQISARPYVLY